MKNKPEVHHTPTPWILIDDPKESNVCHVDGPTDKEYGMISCYGENRKANAAFIVRAVNAHEELLRVCKMIYESEHEQDKFAEPWMIELGEAIAKAEGK